MPLNPLGQFSQRQKTAKIIRLVNDQKMYSYMKKGVDVGSLSGGGTHTIHAHLYVHLPGLPHIPSLADSGYLVDINHSPNRDRLLHGTCQCLEVNR